MLKCVSGSHDPVFEAQELLLLLLPAFKVGVDQRLQLHQVFVLTLLLHVLRHGDSCHSHATRAALACRSRVGPESMYRHTSGRTSRLTSKSTFSPSGIFGADGLSKENNIKTMNGNLEGPLVVRLHIATE